MNKFHGLLRSTRAATAVEYGLILALIFVAAMLAITAVGTSTNKMWTKVSDTSVNAMGGG
ncbi:MAG: Flp family type IVb pilin [Sphingopyxis sp.]|jgi:pilus assembly protein Flp/PilA|uniref:Flp family type IVb pilin n=1 Tax=Sphingopyxis sp. TaxID=1908224 RepID=UPI001A50D1A4|nr:Flp family type IVb pilin [Sphingopyxis sp.]MBL9071881.1 Flp family type IVb pilin [Sphingopyxis sp.]